MRAVPERRGSREVRRHLHASDHAARAGRRDRPGQAFAKVLRVADRGRRSRHHHRRLDRRVLRATAAGADRPRGLCQGGDRPRLPLIVGTGAIRTEDSVAYAKHAREIGADAILVASPPYAVPTERENAVHALTIDRAADLPIMLYNYPGRDRRIDGRGHFCRGSVARGTSSRDQGELGRPEPGPPAGAAVPAHCDVLRLGRPGARVLCLGLEELGLRRIELPPQGAHRSLRGLRR